MFQKQVVKQLEMKNSRQLEIPNNAMLTGIPGSVTPELIVIHISYLNGGYLITEKNPNAKSAQAQTLWNAIVGTKEWCCTTTRSVNYSSNYSRLYEK